MEIAIIHRKTKKKLIEQAKRNNKTTIRHAAACIL
jgi:hypothetical protein